MEVDGKQLMTKMHQILDIDDHTQFDDEEIIIEQLPIDDDYFYDLASIIKKQYPKLKYLTIWRTYISDEGAKSLSILPIESLDASSNRIGDIGAISFVTNKYIQSLTFMCTNLTDLGAIILKHRSTTKHINLDGNWHCSSELEKALHNEHTDWKELYEAIEPHKRNKLLHSAGLSGEVHSLLELCLFFFMQKQCSEGLVPSEVKEKLVRLEQLHKVYKL